MTTLMLKAPLAGWVLPITEVPDAVFAQRMAGDGVAIDPTGNVLHAPCDGEVVPMQGAKHALTIRAKSGQDILLHVGIDTVQLGGSGFEMLVMAGQQVVAGQPLLKFDLDLVARKARSSITPILLASEGAILRRVANCHVAVGNFLFEMEAVAAPQTASVSEAVSSAALSRFFSVPFDHGLHARPAATIAASLRPFNATVTLVSRGRQANARSTVATMSLGIHRHETIEVKATGADAERAMQALEKLLASTAEDIVPIRSGVAAPETINEIPKRIDAVIACRGVAVGAAAQMSEPELPVIELGAGFAGEHRALRTAIDAVRGHLQGLASTAPEAQRSILDAHIELIQDPELESRANDWLQRGKSAGHAWRASVRSTIEALRELDDPHMMERIADFHDLENQVLRVLAGHAPGVSRQLPASAILLADELLPSQLVALDKGRIAGICTARGGPTSHVAIIAAAMGIPALVAAGPRVLAIADGTALIVDADNGCLHIDPPRSEQETIERELGQRKLQYANDVAVATREAQTVDHVRIKVYANLGALVETPPAVANGAEGCGLLRSEFLFLDRHSPPDEDEQLREYQGIADALGSRPLTVRTMDIGGDKPIPYLPLPREENPALGLRGLRTSLWQPELLRTQLRSILRVTPASRCRILLPMVTDIGDVRTVRSVIDELRAQMSIAESPSLGVMIETPASALLADQLVREVDFLSIGTNDLSQYALAMDRGHPELAAKLDALHPAVLRLIATAASAGNAHHKEIAVCGGLASDPVAIPILIGLGVHELSAVPAMIPRIKNLVRSLDASACRDLAQQALDCSNAAMVRTLVTRWQSARAAATNQS
jgi:phosphoenolpyruvate-protein phosphotransferase